MRTRRLQERRRVENAVMQYLEKRNANPKPFVWTRSADKILEKGAGAKQALESHHQLRYQVRLMTTGARYEQSIAGKCRWKLSQYLTTFSQLLLDRPQ
jgi:hypothetical protein